MQQFSHGDKDVSSQHQYKQSPLRMLTLLTIGILMFAVFLSFVSLNGTHIARAAGWTQIWNDEFSGSAGTQVNSSNWLYDTGTNYPGGAANWGTNEVESNTTSTNNVYQDGAGHLVIKPLRNSSGNWTSGRIETQNTSFAAPAGGKMAVEASIQMPNVTGNAALGYWPAFWMLGSAFRGVYTNWPGIGEIDVMENINGINREYGTLHCGVDPGGPCNETTGLDGNTGCVSTTCQASFHTYRVEVDRSTSPEQIRWYLDGVQFWQVSSNNSGMNATTWANAVDHSFFIILNAAIGGAFPNKVCNCTSPSSATASGVPMLVDYLRVYTTSRTIFTPTPRATATPTHTPTTCPSGSFTQGVVNSGSSSALPWFKPCNWTAGYVILHYIRPGLVQQNVYTTYSSSTASWKYTINGLSSGQVLQYSFTYQKSGMQYDTGWTWWTHP